MKTLQVRLPDDLREQADSVLDEIGMDMSTAIRVYLKRVVQSRSIPFPLEAATGIQTDVIPVDEPTQKKMDKVAQAWRKAKG